MSLVFHIAFRFLLKKGGKDFFLSPCFIPIIGIMISTSVSIIALSTINGFEDELNKKILSTSYHISIEPINYISTSDEKFLITEIRKIPKVISTTPYLNFSGLIKFKDSMQFVQIHAIVPSEEIQVSELSNFIRLDLLEKFKKEYNNILIGKGLFEEMKLSLGDWVDVFLPKNNLSKKDFSSFTNVRLKVLETFKLNSQFDKYFAVINLKESYKDFPINTGIKGIAIKVKNIFEVDKISKDLYKLTKNQLNIKTWISKYGYIYQDIRMIRTIVYLAMILLTIIVCFSIVSTLLITIKRRSKEIAIIQTLGTNKNSIIQIFLLQGTIISFIGNILGSIVGYFISKNLDFLVKSIEYIFKIQVFSKKVYFIDFLPTKISILDLISIWIVVFLFSCIFSIYPAYSANKLTLIKILNTV